MDSDIEIRRVRESDVEPLREVINQICVEKWYLATAEGFSLEQSRAYLQRVIENGFPYVVAIHQDRIVGWCDIVPSPGSGYAHSGRLGVAVAGEYRGKGLGRRLMEACLSLARRSPIEKVELEVFTDNVRAVQLYESLGFKVEGVKVRARKLEGRYQDSQLMALFITQEHS